MHVNGAVLICQDITHRRRYAGLYSQQAATSQKHQAMVTAFA
jgi:hypothetical protein